MRTFDYEVFSLYCSNSMWELIPKSLLPSIFAETSILFFISLNFCIVKKILLAFVAWYDIQAANAPIFSATRI